MYTYVFVHMTGKKGTRKAEIEIANHLFAYIFLDMQLLWHLACISAVGCIVKSFQEVGRGRRPAVLPKRWRLVLDMCICNIYLLFAQLIIYAWAWKHAILAIHCSIITLTQTHSHSYASFVDRANNISFYFIFINNYMYIYFALFSLKFFFCWNFIERSHARFVG